MIYATFSAFRTDLARRIARCDCTRHLTILLASLAACGTFVGQAGYPNMVRRPHMYRRTLENTSFLDQTTALDLAPSDAQLRHFRSSMRMWLRTPGHRIRIDHLRELTGRVTIDRPQLALQFVRLRTSAATFGTMLPSDPPSAGHKIGTRLIAELDTMERKALDAAYVYGQGDILKRLQQSPNGWWGIYDERLVPPGSMPSPVVHTERDGYTVERTLLVRDIVAESGHWPQKCFLVRVKESIGRDGTYRELSRRRIPGARNLAPKWKVPSLHL